MTTANKITIVRILLIPFFVTEMIYYTRTGDDLHRFFALVCFAVAAISDGVDGYIARRYNQRSELGAILDPTADKLLLVSAIVVLSFDNGSHLDRIPLWVTATIISRDLLLLLGAILINYTVGEVTVRPRLIGKLATVLQMVMVIWGLLKWDAAWFKGLCVIAAVVAGAAGLFYLWDGIRQLSQSPKSSPSAKQ
jgi:CDP-diacylglycerol--glycerol-3-phosphate 3-phosphatidyltransferase